MLSKRALNALTVQASTTELGKLFQIFTMRTEKNAFVSHNEMKGMILQFIVVVSGVSSFVERKIR